METFSPVVDVMNTTSQGISSALSLASGVLQTLSPLLAIGEIPSLDFGGAIRTAIDGLVADIFQGSIDAFHLYPESQHKIYTYRFWLDLAERIITEEGVSSFGSNKRLMVWLVSAPDQDTLLASVSPLLALFGLPSVEFEPASVSYDPLADYIPPTATSRPVDVIPGLRDLADGLLATKDSFSAAQGLSDIASGAITMLQRKADLLTEKIQVVSQAIATLEAIANIEISRLVIDAQSTPNDLVDELRGAVGAPGQTELVAGSIFAYDEAIASFVESLL